MTEVVNYYPNGQIASIGFMRNNQPDGYWISFHPNGHKASEGNRHNFKLDGRWVFYDTLGMPVSIIEYQNGLKNGIYLNYLDGSLIDSSYFVNDTLKGYKFYYLDNFLHKVVEYNNGVEDGYGFMFYRNGELHKLLLFKRGYLTKEIAVNKRNENNKYDGIFIELSSSLKIIVEGFYKNGKKHGLFKYYNNNGELIKYELWEDDVLVENKTKNNIISQRIEFYSGTIIKKKSGFYMYDSIPVGNHFFYDSLGNIVKSEIFNSNGKLISIGLFDEKGNKIGLWTEFYSNGAIKSSGYYVEGFPDGVWEFFTEDGILFERGTYKLGVMEGKWINFCDNGEIRKEVNYSKGELTGASVEFNCNGDTVKVIEYDLGLKEGKYFKKFQHIIEIGTYKEDKREGKWYYYYMDGKLKSVFTYNDDFLNGEALYYDENEILYIKGNYKDGKRDGIWLYYDNNGKKYLSVEYKNDLTIKINGKKI